MKKRIALIICLCLPAIIAAVILFKYTSNSIEVSEIDKVIIHANNKDIELSKSEDISFFVSIIDDGIKIETSANPLADYQATKIDFIKLSKTLAYTFYLSTSPDDCIYSTNNKLYRIPTDLATQLLARSDMQYVYSNSEVPTATFKIGDSVYTPTPLSVTWNYKNANGEYETANETNTFDEVYNCTNTDLLNLTFNDVPDSCIVKIYNGEEVVFDDFSSNLSNFNYSYDATLKAVVEAKWEYDEFAEDNDQYGNLVYEINFNYDVPASYAISETTTNPGELLVLKLENSNDESYKAQVGFTTADNLKFYKYNNAKIMLIPVSYNATPGEYNIILTGTNNTFTIPITITEKSFDTINLDTTSAGFTTEAYAAAITETEGVLSTASAQVSDEVFWKSNFISPIDNSLSWIYTRFGSFLNINDAPSQYRHIGISYAAEVSTPILVPNDGVVVYAGETALTGKTVIIEHGFGLQTSYFHLDTVLVNQGEKVYQSQMLGRLGKSGISIGDDHLQFNASVGGIYVNPISIINSIKDFFNITSIVSDQLIIK